MICNNEDHEHSQTIDGVVEPMICAHCDEPCHYDSTTGDYHHDIGMGDSLELNVAPHTCWLHKVPAPSICLGVHERAEIILFIDGLTVLMYGCHVYTLINREY